MEKRVIVICCVVGFLGLLSAATGFGAEATKIKSSEVQVTASNTCNYPRSPAWALGYTAALSLFVAQVVISCETGCLCCRWGPCPSNSKWTLAVVCFVVSWVTFVFAFLLFLTGAALNDSRGMDGAYFTSYTCYVVKPGVFAGGAVLALASVLLMITHYFIVNLGKNIGDTRTNYGGPAPSVHGGGIAMGQPQFPPPPRPTEDPVFVHEDTYMRRQFT